MESILNALESGSLVAWALLIVVLIIGIKLLIKGGKGVVIFMICVGCFFVLMKFFPGVAEPIADFIGGSWMNDPWSD
jgi:hypothetical protein